MSVLNRFNGFKVFTILFFVGVVALILSACGAQTTISETPRVGAVSFSNDVLPILQVKCVGCHGGEKTSRGLKLNSFDNLVAGSNNGAVVIAGDPDNSKMLQLIIQGKMPKRGGKLSSAQVEIFKEWIKAGALNN
jgi:hypothetical protein